MNKPMFTKSFTISIHALREEGDLWFGDSRSQEKISIHALREEGDDMFLSVRCRSAISIHALREEGDKYFLGQSQQAQDFYPRPPRGGRPAQ